MTWEYHIDDHINSMVSGARILCPCDYPKITDPIFDIILPTYTNKRAEVPAYNV